MLVITATLFAAAAAFVSIYTLVTPGRRAAVPNRLSRFERGETQDRQALLAEPFSARVATPLAARIRKLVGEVLPSSVVSSIERRLLIAGEPASLYAFLTIQLLAIGAGIFLAVI